MTTKYSICMHCIKYVTLHLYFYVFSAVLYLTIKSLHGLHECISMNYGFTYFFFSYLYNKAQLLGDI